MSNKTCFNCFYRGRVNPENEKADPIECQTCRCISDTDGTPTNWKPRSRNKIEQHVIRHIIAGTLKDFHTREQLADILRVLEPHLVEQSPNACRSMCKQRMCDHLEFAIKLHGPSRGYLEWLKSHEKGECK